jgi:two-component system CheB/CheR fusion protein
LNVILQFYGLSDLLLGLLVLVWPKQETNYSIAGILWLLGAFGLSHSMVEWIELWRELQVAAPVIDPFQPFFLLLSYLFLFEFGRRLLLAAVEPEAANGGLLLSRWIYAAPLVLFAAGVLLSNSIKTDLNILPRYFVGFPGALLTGNGFLQYWRRVVSLRPLEGEYARIRIAFHVLGAAFIAFALLSGMIVPAADWFPASLINNLAFQDAFHFPVEAARAACAFAIVVALMFALRIFDIEAWMRLNEARAASERGEKSFRRANRQYEVLLRTASDGIHILDMEGNVVEANDAFCEMLGYSHEEVIGMNVREWDAFFSPEEIKGKILTILDKLSVFETRHRRRDGRIFDVEVSAVGVHLDDVTLLYCSSRDITSRKQVEEQLRLVAKVYDRAAEGVMITDHNQKILVVNAAFTEITGYAREEVVGKTPAVLKSGRHDDEFYKHMWADLDKNGWWQGEIWNRRKDGQLHREWLSINAVRNDQGRVENYIGMFGDITQIRLSRQRMEHLATHDELTNLPNRTLFSDHLRLVAARAARTGSRLALLLVDLDNFKLINEALGHEEGDLLLVQVAHRLRECAREEDIVSRLGGDEFVLLFEIEDREEAGMMAKRVLEAFSPSFRVQGHDYFISCSIGIAIFPEDSAEPNALLRSADTAMYRAKDQGKNTHVFFTADMAVRVGRRVLIENSLRLGLQNNELFLEYQPQFDLASKSVVGAEALLRWKNKEEVIYPNIFLRIAEESGLISEIDEWVIAEVCRQVLAWDCAGVRGFPVSINLSSRHFLQPKLLARLAEQVAGARIQPHRLCLEIAESVLVDIEPARRLLGSLHESGFRISVDNFGSGHASQWYLKRFALDEVKIHPRFIGGVADNRDDRAFTQAIINLAQELNLHTVAKGVETEVQLKALRELGCDAAQGSLLSDPLPAQRLQERLVQAAVPSQIKA